MTTISNSIDFLSLGPVQGAHGDGSSLGSRNRNEPSSSFLRQLLMKGESYVDVYIEQDK